jgi:spore cortex biosynthesis protein YabQ
VPLLKLDLQFYAFFMVIVVGAVLGLMFDMLRVMRGHYRPNAVVGAAADLLFWVVATMAITGGLFFGNWGELRFYVLVGTLLGVGLYYLLASSLVMAFAHMVIRVFEWLVDLLVTIIMRMVWAPLLWLGALLWSVGKILWRWVVALFSGISFALVRILGWIFRPFRGPYRYGKLHYLLTKRRLLRWLRRWL